MSERLAVVALPGLRPDMLGNYLATLGLLRVAARKWPCCRLAWLDGEPRLVGGPSSAVDLVEALVDVASRSDWAPYKRGWTSAQKADTKSRSSDRVARWQASAEEDELELALAHIVPAKRNALNPLLGSGGNAGKRDFATGWQVAVRALAAPGPQPARDLEAVISGASRSWLIGKLNAASWFSDANKQYNSGQRAFAEGNASPWTMVLAVEGLALFAGTASRRLGARALAAGAFPFVTRPVAPTDRHDAGHDLAEFWAPIWPRPASLPETAAILRRGRAEVTGRAASTPGAFATAIARRGVDAGIGEFRRFMLGRTTSANTFESRFEGAIAVAPADDFAAGVPPATRALESVLRLLDGLPRDAKKGKRWRVEGLRGPIERAMTEVAQRPEDPDAACALLDSVVATLDRVDRKRSYRERGVRWKPLPLAWLPHVFGERELPSEERLALAAVANFSDELPFAAYRFGVEHARGGHFVHAERPPPRWSWRAGSTAHLLSEVVRRCALDWDAVCESSRARSVRLAARAADVGAWLDGLLDDMALDRWVSRLALFDWRRIPRSVREIAPPATGPVAASGALAVHALLQPLFGRRALVRGDRELLPADSGARTGAGARTLATLLSADRVVDAVRFASGRYAMACSILADRGAEIMEHADGQRLLASMSFPLSRWENTMLIERWLRPRRTRGDEPHA